ncbi:LOW QUALITY PROTEIN: potassium transporter 5-like [Pyrus x bretschneideri]|uniref:LOW QUALITY PROTEIN: potassium transporter 5-like n=1 Tax=Pyrus x bretschneideri TaxID=225117 RepID=UPI00202DDF15|nr:LOW QUALITY PROTEIN: potassium transporter 5-like [Pyrus x bretschneideri]
MAGKVVSLKEEETEEAKEITNQQLKERKVSWAKLRRVDSLNLEAGRVSMNGRHGSQANNWHRTLSLAFQSIGIVYGDIGTSPLYVYASTFPHAIDNNDDIIGVLSLIIYTIALLPLLKYAFIVLWANDNGDGGTFALYSLICRHAKVSLIPNNQPEDRELSNYKLEIPSNELKRSQTIKKKLENSKIAKYILFLVTIMGTSMVIGDGVLTPCISVLSAVGGIKSLGTDAVVGISIAILIILFSAQRFGTDKVGFTFAPIILVWFMFIGGIGLYNLFKHDISVLRAFNPKYIIDFFRRNGKKGWISLGGIFLCITGTEAMFADLGHFSVKAIQVSFSCITFPALVLAYSGQAAFLRKFPGKVDETFYDSIPDPLYWPTFVVAVAAAIIASQAMISGAFSIISQSLSLGCFPRVKVVHTSAKYEGQVYIPEINYMLMVACVIVTAAFKTTEKIGNAYGIAVVSVMVITTCLLTLIMLVIWKTSIWLIGLFFVVFFCVEVVYASAVMYKFVQGGFLPLVFSFFLMVIMGIWHYVHHQRYMFELKNKVSSEYMKQLASNPNINRVPGIGLLYSELVQGIPPIFSHFVNNIPSIHSVIVIVSIKPIPFSKVALEERFLFRQLEPRDYRMFRCVARYGYNDRMGEPKEFEEQLVEHLKEFIRHEHFVLEGEITNEAVSTGQSSNAEESAQQVNQPRGSSGRILSFNTAGSTSNGIVCAPVKGAAEETQFVQEAMEEGIVYLLGQTEVVAGSNSSLFKRIVVNHVYSFLRKNFRQGEQVMRIPRTRLLRVGMTYEI